jgi:hypothetical protein
MRLFMAALTVIGLGLAATSGAYAAPINATSIGKSAGAIAPLTTVRYYRHHHYYRHRYYRHHYYDPTTRAPIIIRPYYYGSYYYRPYYQRNCPPLVVCW